MTDPVDVMDVLWMAVEGLVAELPKTTELIEMAVIPEAEFEAIAANPVEIDAVENAAGVIVSDPSSETDAVSTS